MPGVISCSSVASRTDFAGYIKAIERLPGSLSEAATVCKSEICDALWGYGNPDIDGIGMVTGYILSNILGLVLALTLWWYRHTKTRKGRKVAIEMFKSWFESALVFSASLQIAATITLGKLNFGVSANGMGDTTARITWAVSVITLIPLLYFVFLPGLCEDESAPSTDVNVKQSSGSESEESQDQSGSTSEDPGRRYERETFDFFLFLSCCVLGFYPFVSRIASVGGRSQIGPHGVISQPLFDKIARPCFANVDSLTKVESQIVSGFGLATYSIILLMNAFRIASMVIWWFASDGSFILRLRNWIVTGKQRGPRFLRGLGKVLLLVGMPLLAVAQAWTIIRLRKLQWQMAKSAGGQDPDDGWTFGQIIALTVFTPVFISGAWKWRENGGSVRGIEAGVLQFFRKF